MSKKTQEDIFKESEANKYFQRNMGKLESIAKSPDKNHTITCLKALNLQPNSILEVGCGNGWRLNALQEIYHVKCYGLDPSDEMISQGQKDFPQIAFRQGTAENLPYSDNSFELLIFGFCLYLCSREHLFHIAYEADRVLVEKGHVAVLDFHPPFPCRNPYGHNPDVTVYKMNYANMFAWNPAYTLITTAMFNEGDGSNRIDNPSERASVAILQKNTEIAYINSPWPR